MAYRGHSFSQSLLSTSKEIRDQDGPFAFGFPFKFSILRQAHAWLSVFKLASCAGRDMSAEMSTKALGQVLFILR